MAEPHKIRHLEKLDDAAKIIGLSRWELYSGFRSGKYPGFRVGGPHGRIVFDMDLLDKRIEQLMRQNVEDRPVVLYPNYKIEVK